MEVAADGGVVAVEVFGDLLEGVAVVVVAGLDGVGVAGEDFVEGWREGRGCRWSLGISGSGLRLAVWVGWG